MMNRWRDKLRQFMTGRYGMDQLNQYLMYGVLILLVLNIFFGFLPFKSLGNHRNRVHVFPYAVPQYQSALSGKSGFSGAFVSGRAAF